MPKDFIERKVGTSSIQLARKQQRQLAYFTQSSIQEEINISYLEQWAERKFRGQDDFLNWVKVIFKEDNFLSFYKYLRFPVSSSKLINKRVIPELKRVFFAEDSFFNYTINGENAEAPANLRVKEFNEIVFKALMFHHNDIMVHDLVDINTPVRHLVSIDNVRAIESNNNVIRRLAFSAELPTENGLIQGFLFMDSERFQFLDKNTFTVLLDIPHDLGECPADYVAAEAFADDDIVRKSIYSYVREELEEFVFLKTLQRMTEPNGAIPIATVLKNSDNKGDDMKGSSEKHPMSSKEIGSQKAQLGNENSPSKSILQTGTVVKVKPPRKNDGSVDMGPVKDFINFFHMPVEQLDYINKRVEEIEQSIVLTLVGVVKEGKEKAMNELQNKLGVLSKEDRLREFSFEFSRIRQRSDSKILGLEFGPDRITNEANYGTKFFQATQQELLDLYEKAPNPIERRKILIKLAQTENKFDKDKSAKEELLNKLLPYPSDLDFDKSLAREGVVTDTIFQYQTRFTYWIGIFEAQFGDILEFSRMIEGTESEKLVLINNLITQIINQTTTETITE